MHQYYVGIREVHVNVVEVTSEVPLTREEVLDRAEEKIEAGVDSYCEYSHTMDREQHTVEEW